VKTKLKAAKAEMRIRTREYNASKKALVRIFGVVTLLEIKIANMAKSKR
jgi:hypothetical protein